MLTAPNFLAVGEEPEATNPDMFIELVLVLLYYQH